MTERFAAREVLPGVHHICDAMGVCCTLLVGRERALLFDTGYGLFDPRPAVAAITQKPLQVVLSHGHHDHACGAAWFDEVWLHPADEALLAACTNAAARTRVLGQARARGVLPAAYDDAAYMAMGTGRIRELSPDGPSMDLGDMEVILRPVPGHTAGSLCAFVPSRQLLLTGDNWNPTTWLFFRESAPLPQYVRCMKALDLAGVSHVLASHEAALMPGERLRQYVGGLRADVFGRAEVDAVGASYGVATKVCYPEPGTKLVFDANRAG